MIAAMPAATAGPAGTSKQPGRFQPIEMVDESWSGVADVPGQRGLGRTRSGFDVMMS